MPRSRAATRLRIVEGAYALFYRQGFARVSMDQISARGWLRHAGVRETCTTAVDFRSGELPSR